MLVLVALLGAAIGSFLGVVVDRFNTGIGLGGRSMCFTCQRVLVWYELIPVFSFLVLRRHCRRCGSVLSWDYIAIELVAALAFALSWLRFGVSWHFVIAVILGSLFIVLAAYDLRHKILPDIFTVLVGLVAVLTVFVLPMGQAEIWWHYPLYGLLAALPFGLLWLFSGGRLMGFGDVKLIAVLGLLLGKLVVPMLLIAFWSGAFVGVVVLLLARFSGQESGRAAMQQQIPFGPFLVAAAFIVLLYGNVLAQFWPTYFAWLV